MSGSEQEEYEQWGSENGGNDGWGNENNSDQGDETLIEIQNTFDEADDLKKQSPGEALEKFETVYMMEDSREEKPLSFQALQNIVVISSKLGKYENMVRKTKLLLKMMNKVARNDANDAINQILDAVGDIKDDSGKSEMYQLIMESLKVSNERLWFNTSLRLGKIHLDTNEISLLDILLS